MGKNKLQKFADMSTYSHVFQYPFSELQQKGGFPMKSLWKDRFFKNDHPIILELGCGKGEYAVALARRYPEFNFIGVDIKGARMWSGAKQALEEGLSNVAFLRTNIELIGHFFSSGEVDQIWITFPDPQMKKVNKRLTSTRFLTLYKEILAPNGKVHLKTDSPFLYTYTKALIEVNQLNLETDIENIYSCSQPKEILTIKTHYEQQWLDRGKEIKYLEFIPGINALIEPEIEIEYDDYRSYNRSKRSASDKGF